MPDEVDGVEAERVDHGKGVIGNPGDRIAALGAVALTCAAMVYQDDAVRIR